MAATIAVALVLAFHDRLLRGDEALIELLKWYGGAAFLSFLWMPVLVIRRSWRVAGRVWGGAALALVAGLLMITLHPPLSGPAHFPSGLFLFGSLCLFTSSCLGCLLKIVIRRRTETAEL
jgi:hypothetical protein